MIPAPEPSAPLGEEVAAAAPAAAEPAAEAPATNGDKPAVKSDKRKSSLPFFGKKEKAPAAAPAEGEEAAPAEKSPAKPSAFSKIRNTIRVCFGPLRLFVSHRR